MTDPATPEPKRRLRLHCTRSRITSEQIRALRIPDDIPVATPEQVARWKAAEQAPPARVPWRWDGASWHAEFDGFFGRVSGQGPYFWIYIDLRKGDANVGYEATAEAARAEVACAIGWAIVALR